MIAGILRSQSLRGKIRRLPNEPPPTLTTCEHLYYSPRFPNSLCNPLLQLPLHNVSYCMFASPYCVISAIRRWCKLSPPHILSNHTSTYQEWVPELRMMSLVRPFWTRAFPVRPSRPESARNTIACSTCTVLQPVIFQEFPTEGMRCHSISAKDRYLSTAGIIYILRHIHR